MTTDASAGVVVEYEGGVPTAGGPDAADFHIRREGRGSLECALYLALDAKQRFETACGPLSDQQTQALLRAIAGGLYPALIADGVEPPAIITIRATDFDDEQFEYTIGAAGLSRLPSDG